MTMRSNQVSFPLCYLDGELVDVPTETLGSEGLTDFIINHRQPLLFSQDVLEGMRHYGISFVPLGDDEPSQSWLGVPMMYGDEVIGVISVQSLTTAGLYTERRKRAVIIDCKPGCQCLQIGSAISAYSYCFGSCRNALYWQRPDHQRFRCTGNLSVLVETTALKQFDHSSILFFDTPWQDVMPTFGTLLAVHEKSGEVPVGSLGLVSNLAEIPFTSIIQRNEPIFIPDVKSE